VRRRRGRESRGGGSKTQRRRGRRGEKDLRGK